MASSEGKIAGAITGLAMAVVFAFVVVPEIKEWQARRELERALRDFEAGTAAALQQLDRQHAETTRRTREAAYAREQALLLRSGEQCVGGSVVRVTRKDGVPSYRQVLERGRPVRCAGNKRI
jgi:uncharacterized membrane protein YccC